MRIQRSRGMTAAAVRIARIWASKTSGQSSSRSNPGGIAEKPIWCRKSSRRAARSASSGRPGSDFSSMFMLNEASRASRPMAPRLPASKRRSGAGISDSTPRQFASRVTLLKAQITVTISVLSSRFGQAAVSAARCEGRMLRGSVVRRMAI
jgi:hypothetical protein